MVITVPVISDIRSAMHVTKPYGSLVKVQIRFHNI